MKCTMGAIFLFFIGSLYQVQAAPDRVVQFETGSIANKHCQEIGGNMTAGHIDIPSGGAIGELSEGGINYEYVNKGWAVGCTCPVVKMANTESAYCPVPPLEGRVWITGSDSYESNKSIVFEGRSIFTHPDYELAPDYYGIDGTPIRPQTRQKMQYNLFPSDDVEYEPGGEDFNLVGNRNWLSFAFSIADPNNPHWYQTDGQDAGNVPSDSTTIVQIWQGAPSFSYHIEPQPANFVCTSGTADAVDPVVLTAYVYNLATKRTQDPHDPVFRRCVKRGEWYRVGMAYQMPEYIAEGKDTPSDPSEDNGLLRGFIIDENGSRVEQLFYLPQTRTDWGFKPRSTCPSTNTNTCTENGFIGKKFMQVNFGLYRDRQPHKQIIKFDSIILGDSEGNAFIPISPR